MKDKSDKGVGRNGCHRMIEKDRILRKSRLHQNNILTMTTLAIQIIIAIVVPSSSPPAESGEAGERVV